MEKKLGTVGATVVISLPRKRCNETAIDRISRMSDWPFPAPVEFSAIDTTRALPATATSVWRSRGARYIGLYGCMLSHRAVLEQFTGRVLVLEDDAVFCDGFCEKVSSFFDKIPTDWDAIALGGRVKAEKSFTTPEKSYPKGSIDEKTFRAYGVKDTVAYIVTDAYRKTLLELNKTERDRWGLLWANPQFEHKFYAPVPWLVTQAPGWSHCRQTFEKNE